MAGAPRRWPTWLALAGVAACALVAGLALAPTIAPALSRSVGWVTSARSPALTLPAAPATLPVTGAASQAIVAAAPAITISPAPDAPAPASGATLTATLDALLAGAAADESAAWRTLAGLWGAKLAAGRDACAAALEQSLHCYRGRGGLAPIRELDRPGVLKLIDPRGRAGYVVLVGLSGSSATLRDASGNDLSVPLAQLARAWRGEFATFWRAPSGYRDGEVVGATGSVAPWMADRLSTADSAASGTPGDEALKSRVFAFQLAHGLEPDGVAGPLTLMQMNRASGVDEPRLRR